MARCCKPPLYKPTLFGSPEGKEKEEEGEKATEEGGEEEEKEGEEEEVTREVLL